MRTSRPSHAARCSLRVLAVGGFLTLCAPASADTFRQDTTPLPAAVTNGQSDAPVSHSAGGGGAVLRLVVGLAVVLALVWVVRRLLRGAQKGSLPRALGGDVQVVATTPLTGSRAIHLLRVGEELILVGAADEAVTPLRVYSPDEARALLDRPDDFALRVPTTDGGILGRLLEELRRRTAR